MLDVDELEVEEGDFDIGGENISMVGEILTMPEKIIIKTETTEEPQDYAGVKIKKRSKKTIHFDEMLEQAQMMSGPAPNQPMGATPQTQGFMPQFG